MTARATMTTLADLAAQRLWISIVDWIVKNTNETNVLQNDPGPAQTPQKRRNRGDKGLEYAQNELAKRLGNTGEAIDDEIHCREAEIYPPLFLTREAINDYGKDNWRRDSCISADNRRGKAKRGPWSLD